MPRILITGVPGTGKTTLSKLISRLAGIPSISINAEAKKAGLVKRGGETNLKKLEAKLKAEIKKKGSSLILEGHLGSDMKLPVDLALVLRCDPKKLERRLKKRGYSGKKLSDNLLSEALDYCTVQVEANYGKRKVKELDTEKRTAGQAAKLALELALGKKKKGDSVNWKAYLEKIV